MFIFTIPAVGHVNSMLHMIQLLSNKLSDTGRKIYVFTTPKFKVSIEGVGGTVILYPFTDDEIDTTQGSNLITFSTLVLRYSSLLIGDLIRYHKMLKPKCIIHDSAAYWGKILGYTTNTPTIGFCSYLCPMNNATKWQYFKNFKFKLLKELTGIFAWRRAVKQLLSVCDIEDIFSPMDTLMGIEYRNIIAYPEMLQKGDLSNERYIHVGSLSLKRPTTNGVIKPVNSANKILYISLGTIATSDIYFWLKVLNDFRNSDWVIYISDSSGGVRKILSQVFNLKSDGECYKIDSKIYTNIYIADYVNQREFLKYVDVYLTACGQNSISEAVLTATPMLLAPQQGEQKIVADRLKDLQVGVLYNNKNSILNQVQECLKLKDNLDKEFINNFTMVNDDLMISEIFFMESMGVYVSY